MTDIEYFLLEIITMEIVKDLNDNEQIMEVL
jgi:hypothetical protein